MCFFVIILKKKTMCKDILGIDNTHGHLLITVTGKKHIRIHIISKQVDAM